MNIQEKKYLASPTDGGLDADSADFVVGTNKVVNAENVRWGSTDTGVTGVVESVGGTRQISEGLPSLTFYSIGKAIDDARNRIIWFKWCVSGPWHRITCYEKDTDTEYVVLLASQVIGGLNFSKDSIIHSAVVIDGLLIWTDEQDTQHKLNIDAGIKLNNPSYDTDEEPYTTPIESAVISLIKRPPAYPLEIEKVTQPSVLNNFIGDNVFWFSYRYFFRDKETSVPACHSQAVQYNISTDTYNAVDVTVPLLEYIDQDVQLVEIGVRTDADSQFFGIKTWNRDVAADATAIANHNAGTTALTFRFYNNTIGEPWGDANSVKPFESCPIQSKTLALVRNRIHLGNNTSGYDTPISTSLSVVPNDQTEGATIDSGFWWQVVYNLYNESIGYYDSIHYVLQIEGAGGLSGFYSYLPYPGVELEGDIPAAVDYLTDLIFLGSDIATISYYWSPSWAGSDVVGFSVNKLTTSSTITSIPTTVDLIGANAFKTGSTYQAGVVFFDQFDRKCGTVTSDSLIVETADRDYSTVNYTVSLDWTLSNLLATTEIPLWAKTYAVVLTKCLRTRYFLQARVANLSYATMTSTFGTYEFTNSTYSNQHKGVGVNISSLQSFNAGYQFQQGDMCKVYIDAVTTPFYLKIIAQQGEWIICDLQDLGTIGTTASPFDDALFEVYTPYQQSTNEFFYEMGSKYQINNWGTANRTYSVTNGSIRGDIVLLNRGVGVSSYLTENMSGNDKFYQNWYTDAGRGTVVTRLGQVYKPNSVHYSNTFVLGSNINGLCEFEALNERFVPYECGQIQKLQVASKVQNEQGAVMLAICESQTASLYIGEVQLVGASSNAFLAQSPEVIGTINVLKGNFGTTNPESVVEYRGLVFWVDVPNGRVIQYSANGLFPISSYKMTRYWKLFSDQYASMTLAQIEALGSRPFIFTQVDPYHNELLITVPKLLSTPPKGYLPDLGLEVAATGSITITDIGDDGDSIQVLVDDPSLGSISLGTYVRQSSDTNNIILAASIANAIASNPYGYTATSSSNVVTITARSGLGASINGGMRLSVNILPDKLLINNTDFLLINSNSKLLL